MALAASWLDSSGERLARIAETAGDNLAVLSQPANTRRIKWALAAVACLWLVLAGSQLVWSLWPRSTQSMPEGMRVLNPVELEAAGGAAAEPVDIARLVGWHLFGEATAASATPVAPAPVAFDTQRDGIEKGARESSLNLTLTGIVASTEAGMGYAIIEYKKKQQVYAVDDDLPVGRRVKLAKVMADRVVIDNGGTYELLKLFDKSTMQAASPAPSRAVPAPQAARPQPAAGVNRRRDTTDTTAARSYRQRLYEDPQSLAQMVQVSAVRENDLLSGYRVEPGQDKQQFERLGFKAGDVVTGVNGIALDDPAKAMQLYQVMRTAREAVFTVRRQGQEMELTVALDDPS
jgi:general secretion pathway protein C